MRQINVHQLDADHELMVSHGLRKLLRQITLTGLTRSVPHHSVIEAASLT